jgi:hypothetical protein
MTDLYDDWWTILVDCPRCDGAAVARRSRSEPSRDGTHGLDSFMRVTCAACGLSREGRLDRCQYGGRVTLRFGRDAPWKLDRRLRAHRRWPRAEVEELPYFLRSACCGGEVLWARNGNHLAAIEGFVRAELRDGVPGGYKLPHWIVEAKHRDEVLHHLALMREKLAAAQPSVATSMTKR